MADANDPSLLGEILIRYHGVSLRAVQQAMETQGRTEEPIGQLLLAAGHISRDQLRDALVEQMRIRRVASA